jgi:ADP-dependent NAD(P)H-hydrate dehydratase / NAD(P)H-hydrate epimerase
MPDPTVNLYTVAEIRAAEAAAGDALHDGTLAHRAAYAVAELAWTTSLRGLVNPCVAVLAGPGNNGTDALLAARLLIARGVRVVLIEPLAPGVSALRARARADLPLEMDSYDHLPARQRHFDLIIDGLLGIGARPVMDGPMAAVIRQVNAAGVPVLSIDLPSGMNADTGALPDAAVCIQATRTLTMIGHKRGLATYQGVGAAGQIRVASLGLDAGAARCLLDDTATLALLCPHEHITAHKGQRGDVWILGGATGMTGAAWIASTGALATGAGRVFAALDTSTSAADAHRLPQIQTRTWATPVPEHAALVIGCGLGQSNDAQVALEAGVRHPGPLLLDADALNLLARSSAAAAALAQRQTAAVLTPHPLEAARLLGVSAASIQQDRFAAVRALAHRFNAVVVLKGNGSVISAAGSDAMWVSASGHPILATGGTGDCLAGLIGGLLARGLSPTDAARLATWIHGRAAELEAARLGGSCGLDLAHLAATCARMINELQRTRFN